jgi:DNA-3-methyladenine glycosylase I
MMAAPVTRCSWCGDDPLYIAYHDQEWGVPLHDDRSLFELLILEGAQAGLSWITILRKRERYRQLFAGFDPQQVARFDQTRIEQLLQDSGIIRNRLKIVSAVANAQAFLRVREEAGSFDNYIWQFVDGNPIINQWQAMAQVPAQTPESQRMSKDLKKRGFNFVGPTICYAFMQAVGMVNDHTRDCFRYPELTGG